MPANARISTDIAIIRYPLPLKVTNASTFIAQSASPQGHQRHLMPFLIHFFKEATEGVFHNTLIQPVLRQQSVKAAKQLHLFVKLPSHRT